MGTVRCCLLKPSALSHVDCAPGAGADDDDDDVFYLFLQKQKIGAELQAPYIPWTASPTYADFGGLSWLVSLVIVRLHVVPLPPRSSRRLWRVVGWADILLDVIVGVESALREGCPGTMTGVSQYWVSGHFRQVFSTLMHYPALTLAPTSGGNHHDRRLLTLVLVYFAHWMGSV
jgi:hypothetical protein